MSEQVAFWISGLVLACVVAMGCPLPGEMIEHITKECASEYWVNWRYSVDQDACVGISPVPEREAKR